MIERQSPRVNHFKWGVVQVQGYDAPFKDVKLYPGGARAWDWDETGTRHVPGIQPADVEELLTNGATIIILSKGVEERLQVCPETLEMLEARGITIEVLQTEKAIARYNELAQTEAVGALIHSTC
ncbi:MAG: Mth938-like domain-containing protein [Anaerolineae bacterium]|nr:Mth938-like domain-containing protein [Anaerolineae bacterium]